MKKRSLFYIFGLAALGFVALNVTPSHQIFAAATQERSKILKPHQKVKESSKIEDINHFILADKTVYMSVSNQVWISQDINAKEYLKKVYHIHGTLNAESNKDIDPNPWWGSGYAGQVNHHTIKTEVDAEYMIFLVTSSFKAHISIRKKNHNLDSILDSAFETTEDFGGKNVSASLRFKTDTGAVRFDAGTLGETHISVSNGMGNTSLYGDYDLIVFKVLPYKSK
ncbi:MAG: hypothetical protein HYW47_04975 [Deltaproteobacteria bacterium]|nr:hypothetical protein [Deltaproteobacteria bacterium]